MNNFVCMFKDSFWDNLPECTGLNLHKVTLNELLKMGVTLDQIETQYLDYPIDFNTVILIPLEPDLYMYITLR